VGSRTISLNCLPTRIKTSFSCDSAGISADFKTAFNFPFSHSSTNLKIFSAVISPDKVYFFKSLLVSWILTDGKSDSVIPIYSANLVSNPSLISVMINWIFPFNLSASDLKTVSNFFGVFR